MSNYFVILKVLLNISFSIGIIVICIIGIKRFKDSATYPEGANAESRRNIKAYKYYNTANDSDDENKQILLYTKALKLNPELADAYNGRGDAYYFLDDYEEAIADYISAIRIEPKSNYFYNLASAYNKIDEYHKAIKVVDEGIEKFGESADYFDVRGDALDGLKEYQQAIVAYSKAIEINPNAEGALNSRADTYRRIGEYEKGLEDVKRLLVIDPDDGYAYGTRAEILSAMGNDKGFYKSIELALACEYPIDEIMELDGYRHIYNKYKDEEEFIDLLDKYC